MNVCVWKNERGGVRERVTVCERMSVCVCEREREKDQQTKKWRRIKILIFCIQKNVRKIFESFKCAAQEETTTTRLDKN